MKKTKSFYIITLMIITKYIKFRFVAVSAILLFFSCTAHSQILINEFSASNSTQIADPDYAEFADWIELYNAGSSAVNIKGYYLTDDLSKPDKWKITTSISIEAGGHLLFWADDFDNGYHTNFKLSADGEEIGLYNSQQTLLDSVVFAKQETDISYGRKTDGSSEWGFFIVATPGKTNATAYSVFGVSTAEFSVRGGFYNSTINVEITSYQGGDIYYTLDGTVPQLSSSKYISALNISKTTIVRARIFKADCVPGTVATQSYFINENSVNKALPVVSIASDPVDFWDASKGIYVQPFKPEWEVPINIEFFENNGADRSAFNELAGAKVNGLLSWQLPQKMLGIYFRSQYGSSNLNYKLTWQRNRSSYKNFALRASGSDWSSTLFRDILGQQATLLNMKIDMMGFRPSILYVNGQYMGIHNIREKVDDDYIEKSYNIESGTFDMVENEIFAEAGDLTQYNYFLTVLEKGLESDANFHAVANLMDIGNFTDYIITQIADGNGSVDHNIMAWKPKDTGKWRWILMDLDRGFGSANTHLIDYYASEGGFPLKELLDNSNYKAYFGKRLAAHLYTSFNPKRIKYLIAERKAAIDAEMPNHIERWKGTTSAYGNAMPSYSYWLSEVSKLETYADARPRALLNDLKKYGFSSAANLLLKTYPLEAGKLTVEGLTIPENDWSGKYLTNLATTLIAENTPGYTFLGWAASTNENIISTDSEYTFTMTGDTSLIAVYEKTSQCLIPENISTDLTLNIECSPYLATGNITISSGANLTIDAGVEIQMPKGANIFVRGALFANGSSDKEIKFVINPQYKGSSWGVISFNSTDETSTMKYVTIEDASTGPDLAIEIAAITAFKADLILDNMTIEKVFGNPIMARYSDITLTNSSLADNVTGDLINVKYGKAFINNCKFRGNNQVDSDGIDYDEIENGVIKNCTIFGFLGSNSDAIDIGEKTSNLLIDSVTVNNVFDKGVSVGQQSTVTIKNSVFINCGYGVAIKDSSIAHIHNSVFYGNVKGIACYEKNLGNAGGNAFVANSIISNSSDSAFSVDSRSSFSSSYCLTDVLEDKKSFTNIAGNPHFKNPTFNDFSLLSNSPAINAGFYNGSKINMGTLTDASMFEPNVMIYQLFINAYQLNLPEFIALYNPSSQTIDLSNYTFVDGITATIPEGTSIAPEEIIYITEDANSNSWSETKNQIIQWESGKLSNDGETLKMLDGFGILKDCFTFDKISRWPEKGFIGRNIFQLISPNLDNHFGENWIAASTDEILSVLDNNNSSFSIYPNPTTDFIYISGIKGEAEITNTLGILLWKGLAESGNHINVSNFGSGIYFLKITNKNSIETKKFIIMR